MDSPRSCGRGSEPRVAATACSASSFRYNGPALTQAWCPANSSTMSSDGRGRSALNLARFARLHDWQVRAAIDLAESRGAASAAGRAIRVRTIWMLAEIEVE